MTAWRTHMPIYPSSWGWRHKTSIGNLKQGYYPIVCIVPLFLAPAFSNFALRLSNQMGVCQNMSMHVNAHNAHRCVVRFRAIFLATGVLLHRLHHLQRFNRRCPSSWFWEIYTLRTCLWLSADPLPSRKKQKSTIACTCLSRTINSAKWTNSSTLQRILTDQATLTGS